MDAILRTVAAITVVLTGILGLSGCSSIHSESVRSLIEIESDKIESARTNSQAFVAQTRERVSSYRKGIADLDRSLQIVRTDEALYALIFSSHQNVESKTGIDALAIAYLAGILYVNGQAGLEKDVKQQFDTDFRALEDLAKNITGSWESIKGLHAVVRNYAHQTALASVDTQFVAALLKETKVDTSEIDQVIKESKQLNDALKKIRRLHPGDGKPMDSGPQFWNDFVDLLNRVKK